MLVSLGFIFLLDQNTTVFSLIAFSLGSFARIVCNVRVNDREHLSWTLSEPANVMGLCDFCQEGR